MPTIKEKLSDLMKTSMKSGDKSTLAFVRNLHAAIRKKEIDDRVDLDDAAVLKIIGSAMKQRQDSIEQFQSGGRVDLVEKETQELEFLKSFMPAQMSEAEVLACIEAAVKETQAQSIKDLGQVMKVVLPQVQGKADGKWVSQLVKNRLSGA